MILYEIIWLRPDDCICIRDKLVLNLSWRKILEFFSSWAVDNLHVLLVLNRTSA